MRDLSAADALALLRLQLEWGADEALDETPHNRLAPPTPAYAAAMPASAAAMPAGRPAAGGQASQAEAVAAAADSIDHLRTALLGFEGCPLRDTASHTLFAEGDPTSGLMLIGEVPDADEDRSGRLFAGAAGVLLDRMLASIDLTRDRLLIAPLVPWRPPGDRRVNPVEMAACLPFLRRLVVLARPKRLLLMGVRPARAMLDTESPLNRLRGRWLEAAVPGLPARLPALAMRHPSQLLANPASRRQAWHDLLLLCVTLGREASQGGDTQAR